MNKDNNQKFLQELGAIQYAAHKLHDHNAVKDGVNTDVNLFGIISPKAGSFKYIRPDTGEEVVVPPGHPMYSSAGMLATHAYDGEKWVDLENG